jgi:hypothetical protein
MAISKATNKTVKPNETVGSHKGLVHTVEKSTKIRYNGLVKLVKRENITDGKGILKAVNGDFLTAEQAANFKKSVEAKGVILPISFVSKMVLDTAYPVALELSLDYVAVSTGKFTETKDSNGKVQETETKDYKYQLSFKDITFFEETSTFSAKMFSKLEY